MLVLHAGEAFQEVPSFLFVKRRRGPAVELAAVYLYLLGDFEDLVGVEWIAHRLSFLTQRCDGRSITRNSVASKSICWNPVANQKSSLELSENRSYATIDSVELADIAATVRMTIWRERHNETEPQTIRPLDAHDTLGL